MMGGGPARGSDATELTELELSAVGEAMNQMMAVGRDRDASVLGTEVEIAPPATRTLPTPRRRTTAYDATPHAIRGLFSSSASPAGSIQLVPNAFVVRMTRALDELGAEVASRRTPAAAATWGATRRCARSRRPRVGRARPAPDAVRTLVGTPPGAVLELDRHADEPVDLYANGMRFATARLVVSDGGEWPRASRTAHVEGVGS